MPLATNARAARSTCSASCANVTRSRSSTSASFPKTKRRPGHEPGYRRRQLIGHADNLPHAERRMRMPEAEAGEADREFETLRVERRGPVGWLVFDVRRRRTR